MYEGTTHALLHPSQLTRMQKTHGNVGCRADEYWPTRTYGAELRSGPMMVNRRVNALRRRGMPIILARLTFSVPHCI